MNRNTLVYEIGVEEIPSQYVATMAGSLRENATKLLSDLRLEYAQLTVYYTPRRFVLLIEELADEQSSLSLTVKGPARNISFDADGNPTKALLGFLRKNQKNPEDVYFVSDAKAEYVAVDVVTYGKKAVEVLKDGLSKLISQIYNPNPMRWGSYKMKFIRPIRWLLAMYGDQVIPVEIECATADNVSYGHRTLANHAITISDADRYLSEMQNAFVIVDQEKRKRLIVSQIHQLEEENAFSAEIDEALLNEVTNIVEYPICAVGNFDEKYLSLPECIIKDPLKNQQRYFPVYVNGKIMNAFIYTRNGGLDFIDNVTKGNERVLRPRLEDAEFFYNSDLKTSIQDKAAALTNVMFVDNGGSYADKAKRIEQIALRFAAHIGYLETELIRDTAPIMKADLVSAVVREYTDTQGLVGGVFAENEGYDARICTAISEQYLPNFYGDRLPSEPLSAIMSIADKLDTVMCLCAIGLKPGSSGDPYGLRRQILGIFNIALEMGFDVDFDRFILECVELYAECLDAQNETREAYITFLLDYFCQRLKIFLHDEKKFSYDDLNKISVYDLNVYKSVKKAKMIGMICNEQWYLDFLQIFNRIIKLVKSSKEEPETFDSSVIDPNAEAMFHAFYNEKNAIIEDIQAEEYEVAIQKIAEIGKTINAFMERHIALCGDSKLRLNRLAFFADFSNVCGTIIQI